MSNSRLSTSDTSYYPEFLEKILNPDGIVQIGNYIVKINVGKNTAFAIFSNDSLHYSSLLAEDINDSLIYSFPLEMEILEKMDSISTGQNVSSSRTEFWGCRNRWARSNDQEKNASSYGYKIREEFNKFGIYFEIRYHGEIFSNHPDFVINSSTIPAGGYSLRFTGRARERCRIHHNWTQEVYVPSGSTSINWRWIYQGTTALEWYDCSLWIKDRRFIAFQKKCTMIDPGNDWTDPNN